MAFDPRVLFDGDVRVLRTFPDQDSHCESFGVEVGGEHLFVKASTHERGLASLARARAFHERVRHPAVPPILADHPIDGGVAHVYPWVEGELLYCSSRAEPDPVHPAIRFRMLPLAQVLACYDVVLDVFTVMGEAGLAAVDFYDGCILYDFDRAQTHLVDFDECRPGPFELQDERLPGSTRFMAPEEFVRGAVIDEITNVFTLGRTAHVLFTERLGELERAIPVIDRATQEDRAKRQPSIAAFRDEWRYAIGREGA